MALISSLIIAPWAISIPLRLAVFARLTTHRLLFRYPFLAIMIMVSVINSEYLFLLAWFHKCRIDTALYAGMLEQFAPIRILTVVAATVEVFVIFGRHLRNFARAGLVVLSAVFAAATLIGWLFSRQAIDCAGIIGCSSKVLYQTWLATCVAALLAFRGWFGQFGDARYKPNTLRYLWGLGLVLGGQAMANAISRGVADQTWGMVFAQVSLYVLPFVGYVEMLRISAAGEMVAPRPPASFEQLQDSEKRLEAALRALHATAVDLHRMEDSGVVDRRS